MSAERFDPPAVREDDAEPIDLEMMDDGGGINLGGETMSPQDLFRMGPDMLAKTLRGVLLEKAKKWFIRNLGVFTVLALLSIEYKWAKTAIYVWSFVAGIQLALLVFGWFFIRKQTAKFAQMMKGMMPGGDGKPGF